MELMIVIVIIGILVSRGSYSYFWWSSQRKQKLLSAKLIISQNCRNTASAIGAKFFYCALSPNSHLELKSIGGRQTIEKVPCDKNKTNTGQMLNKIINHLNNEGFTNPYGMVGGGTGGVHGAIGAYQQSSGLWWQDLMIKGNNYQKLSLGRCVVQYRTNGEIGVTGFFDKGTYSANIAVKLQKLYNGSKMFISL